MINPVQPMQIAQLSRYRSLGAAACHLLGWAWFPIVGMLFAAPPRVVNRYGAPFPEVPSQNVSSGEGVITALGARLPEIAAWYGESAEAFKTKVRQERSLRADRKGQIHYVCGLLPPVEPPVGGGTGSGAVLGPYPDAQTFLLHSRPGCTKVIYLDFNGHTTSQTQWNTAYTNGANIVTPAYDVDGNPGTFSAQELANIQLIWQRVAEDFSAFDVDVTTEDPGVEALKKTSTSDANYGVRACIGGSSMDWLGQSAGGIAYLKCFDWNDGTPAFVFPAQLGNGAPRYVGEAVSHEVGHTFGLHHDGTLAGVEYYQGTTDWAPIMGSGYYSNIVQWSKGDYSGANNTEDDLAMIAAMVPYRADAVGNTISTAASLSGTNPTFSGTIENRTDVDVCSFTTGAGTIALNLTPASPSGNVYGQLTLYNATGTPLATATPAATSTGAVSLTASVPQGTYYLAVDGVGSGDPLATGFSDYGGIGQYSLSGALISSAASVPPIANAKNSTPLKGYAPMTVNFTSSGSSDPDGMISKFNWNFGDGTANSDASSVSHAYTTAKQYTASLVVTDNSGLSSTDSVVVYVAAANAMYVANITMTTTYASGKYTAKANVTVKDVKGNLKSSATVKGNWSGAVSATGVTAKTGTTGIATLTSASTATKGTFTFTVTGITLTSFVYDSQMNNVNSASIMPPPNVLSISGITMSTALSSGKYSAKANVKVVNPTNGALVSGASVKGNWSGVVSATGASATTATTGIATLTSASTATKGTFTFTVTGITLAGYTYDATKNTITAASITPP